MLTVREQQHSFSTHERVFLWQCQSFWDRKCLDLRGTWTPNLLIWPNYFVCVIHITHEGAMCHAPFSGWKVKGQGHMVSVNFWPCLLRGFIPVWLNHFVHDIHTTHEGLMCRDPFSGWKVKGKGHMDHFKLWPCLLCGFVPIWLNHFICGIHTKHEGGDVSSTISRMKDLRSRSRGSF